MCICKEVLSSAAAKRELKFLRPDKPRLVLGNGCSLLFQVVFVTENGGGREVTLCCDCCQSKWVAKINDHYELVKHEALGTEPFASPLPISTLKPRL